MGILGAISKAKEKFKDQQRKVRGFKARRQASKLSKLREERIYQEGAANLRKMEKQERDRITKAKATAKRPSLGERIGKGHTLKGKGFTGTKGRKLMDKTNPYALGSTGHGPEYGKTKNSPDWSSLGPPTMKKGKKKSLWG